MLFITIEEIYYIKSSKMLTIVTTTEHLKKVEEMIDADYRLNGLVKVSTNREEDPGPKSLLVKNSEIISPIDWYDRHPPYLFPPFEFTKENLMTLVFSQLKQLDEALEYLSEENLLDDHLFISLSIHFGHTITNKDLKFVENSKHNKAILHHYGQFEKPISLLALEVMYNEAIRQAPNDELKVFTGKHYINLLLDHSKIKKAAQVIGELRPFAISLEACKALDKHIESILKVELNLRYQRRTISQMLAGQNDRREFYDSMFGLDHIGFNSHVIWDVTYLKNEFLLSKEFVDKTVKYFKEEDANQFLGKANFKKANLYYRWANNGQPHFYKASIHAYENALRSFKKSLYPEEYATVHHKLALIYSEIPASAQEKHGMSVLSISSFSKALEVFTPENYPYEYAMVCHNYATALIDFSSERIEDSLQNAERLFEEALIIRTSDKYSQERAVTLLNKLKLYWRLADELYKDDLIEKHAKMLSIVKEIKELSVEENIIQEAKKHMNRLNEQKDKLE